MTARARAAQVATGLLGLPPVVGAARRRWADRLRVVDFHDITDADRFDAQMAYIAERYHPVDEQQVRAAMTGGDPLPAGAIWVTFDDGNPTVVEVGIEVLARHGVRATFYVCPGLIEAKEPPWWELVLAAGEVGAGAELDGRRLQGQDLVRALKVRPDEDRRRVVGELRPIGLEQLDPARWVLDREALDRWVDAGHRVGNHTWDHPCLDRCSPSEQASQILRAHDWLVHELPGHRPSFAYPNGDHTDHAEAVLADLGYDLALLSDHQLADPAGDGLRCSRLRLDASAPLGRARAVFSGAHSAGYRWALARRLTGPSHADR